MEEINLIIKFIKDNKFDFDSNFTKLCEKINFLSEKEKDDFYIRVKNKGLYIYELIVNFLLDNKIPLEYKYISSIHMYDKRIRGILYKFIAFIEENVRSRILNNYNPPLKIKKKLYKMTFNDVSNIALKVGVIDNDEFKKIKQINKIRNQVFHNKFILIKNSKINNENLALIKALFSYLKSNHFEFIDLSDELLKDIEKEESGGIDEKYYSDSKTLEIPEVLKLSIYLKS